MSEAAVSVRKVAARAAQDEAGADWLRTPGFESLPGVNEEILELLAAPGTPPGTRLTAPVAGAWRALDAAGRRRAARCPYLLAAARFHDEQRWSAAAQPGSPGDGASACCAQSAPMPAEAVRVARLVYTYAWHLARSQPCAARLILGVPARVRLAIGELTLARVDLLAALHPEWLLPRWPGETPIWSELLRCAGRGDTVGLESVRLQGLQMLAGWAGSHSAPAGPAARLSQAAPIAGVLAGGRRPPVRTERARRAQAGGG